MGTVPTHFQNGSERVICFASKYFTKTRGENSTTKHEFLATVNFTGHFKPYLLGRKYLIVTDHRTLQSLHNFKDPECLTTRWPEKLAAFE